MFRCEDVEGKQEDEATFMVGHVLVRLEGCARCVDCLAGRSVSHDDIVIIAMAFLFTDQSTI